MLHKKIKELRARKGLTQEALGKIVGVSTSMIGMYETGARNPSYEVLLKIADCFNVSTDFLLGNDSDYLFELRMAKNFAYPLISFLDENESILKKRIHSFLNDYGYAEDGYTFEEAKEIYYGELMKLSYDDIMDEISEELELSFKVDKSNKISYYSNNTTQKEDDVKSIEKDLPIIPEEFTNADEARAYVDKHQIFGSSGFDADNLSDDEILEFANELLRQMEMISYKYKK